VAAAIGAGLAAVAGALRAAPVGSVNSALCSPGTFRHNHAAHPTIIIQRLRDSDGLNQTTGTANRKRKSTTNCRRSISLPTPALLPSISSAILSAPFPVSGMAISAFTKPAPSAVTSMKCFSAYRCSRRNRRRGRA
jgi:hypothetical protein